MALGLGCGVTMVVCGLLTDLWFVFGRGLFCYSAVYGVWLLVCVFVVVVIYAC